MSTDDHPHTVSACRFFLRYQTCVLLALLTFCFLLIRFPFDIQTSTFTADSALAADSAGGDTGGETGDTGGETGDTGGETGDTGGETGDTGGETGDTGGETGDTGGETGDTGGETGDTGGETGDTGGETGDTGGETGDTGGETGDTGTGTDTGSGLGLDNSSNDDTMGGDNYESDNDMIVNSHKSESHAVDSVDAKDPSPRRKTPGGFGDRDTSLSQLGTFDSLSPVSSIEEERILGAWDNIE